MEYLTIIGYFEDCITSIFAILLNFFLILLDFDTINERTSLVQDMEQKVL